MADFVINKDRTIGQVLFIVEGEKTEPNLIRKVFCDLCGYSVEWERYNRATKTWRCSKYGNPRDPDSKVIVVNTETSNIQSIGQKSEDGKYSVGNQFLDDLFERLVDEYALDIDNTAIYYLFDRDPKSNTDADFIREMLPKLDNARDSNSPEMLRQGLLLLSYPCVESFTAMNLLQDSISYCWNNSISTGKQLKQTLHNNKKLPNDINESTLLHCAGELLTGLQAVGIDTETESLLNSFDAFYGNNKTVFDCQEDCYRFHAAYGCLSLLCVALLDLGLIRIQ